MIGLSIKTTPLMMRFVRVLLLPISFLLSSPAYARVSQVHLSWQNDPATTMTIIWSTEKNQSPPTVQYGTAPLYTNTASGSDSKHGVILHTVELSGLKPDTLYHYRLSDDDAAWSKGMTFRTAPALGQTTKGGFIVTVSGDKGPYSDAQAVNQQITAQNAHLHLIVGDLVYSPKDDRYHEWLDQQQIYAQFAPLMPTWGNHDTTENDPPYETGQGHFALPTHATPDERY
jgi:phosphodiesterase/alkaline phosphatase D-like protein